MATVHILSQYIWPDSAPTALYADQLAARLHNDGWDVRLVGGSGEYRRLDRPKPPVRIVHLRHWEGRRGRLAQTIIEYSSVRRAFASYIDEVIGPGDVAIVTSAPPNTVTLADRIRRRQGHAVYWLQDYYPELIRGIREYPAAIRNVFNGYWNSCLSRWDKVVKIGGNLRGPSHNSIIIRNWPTFTFDGATSFEPGTALYSGNLGYGHDVALFVTACEQLRDAGYKITVRADGRGTTKLPDWLRVQPLHTDPERLKSDLLRHELHLVAAHPRICHALFPSKIWNSIAAGRRLVCTGFADAMQTELEAAKTSAFEQHLDHWIRLISSVADPVGQSSAQPAAATHQLMAAGVA